MPNWCENILTVTGETEEVNAFVKKAKRSTRNKTGKYKTDFSLDKLVPLPEGLRDTQSPPKDEETKKSNLEKYQAEDWYHWCCNNWGTKWDVTARLEYHNKGEAQYFFDSAWSPPCDGILAISKLYPDLVFHLKYCEPGMVFMGEYEAQNGEILMDESENDVWDEFKDDDLSDEAESLLVKE